MQFQYVTNFWDDAVAAKLSPVEATHEPHVKFRQRVPRTIGFIRTAGTIPYANLILESA